MLTSKEYIESGILELYVLGMTNADESKEVEIRVAADTVIKEELNAICNSLETYAMLNAVEPGLLMKPFLLATIDYTERLKSGEPAAAPPMLNKNSAIEDYSTWLNRNDMKNTGTDDFFAKIIGYTPEAITAIVWLKDYAPHEVHDDEYEKFLIVEGTCNIIVEDEVNQLSPGDYFAIPLHKKHMVKVTSSFPCKVILQRVAA
ncbi:MAG: cupin domain-containing protein [Bacteroidota bacterium]